MASIRNFDQSEILPSYTYLFRINEQCSKCVLDDTHLAESKYHDTIIEECVINAYLGIFVRINCL